MRYTWKWKLDEQSFKEVDWHDWEQSYFNKSVYVEKYLSPSIEHSKCGWDHCVYYVLKNEYCTEEYVALYPDKENTNGRYINVSGDSLGAIAEAIWMSVFN